VFWKRLWNHRCFLLRMAWWKWMQLKNSSFLISWKLSKKPFMAGLSPHWENNLFLHLGLLQVHVREKLTSSHFNTVLTYPLFTHYLLNFCLLRQNEYRSTVLKKVSQLQGFPLPLKLKYTLENNDIFHFGLNYEFFVA